VTELTMPVRVRPVWLRRLRWVVLVGLAGFAYVVVRRLLKTLSPGVL
jgi:hypothetical protein